MLSVYVSNVICCGPVCGKPRRTQVHSFLGQNQYAMSSPAVWVHLVAIRAQYEVYLGAIRFRIRVWLLTHVVIYAGALAPGPIINHPQVARTPWVNFGGQH